MPLSFGVGRSARVKRKAVDYEVALPEAIFYVDAGDTDSYPGTGSTWYDLIGSKDLTIYGSPTYSTSDGGYFVLDNSNDYMDVPTISTNSSSFTFEAWFYSTRTGNNVDYGYLFAGPDAGTGNGGGLALLEGANRTVGGVPLSTGDMYIYTGAGIEDLGYNLPATTWTHIVLGWDTVNDEVKIYADGSLENTVSSVTRVPTAIEFISRFQSGGFLGNYAHGRIALIRVYDEILSSSDISNLYTSSKTRYD